MLGANQAFYEAFEARDMDAMSDVWERGHRVFCTHPGWATLHGWGAVAASFVTLFSNGQRLQFILTDARAQVQGDVGWVTVDENLLGDQGAATVAALNLFGRDGEGRWRLIGHHGAAIQEVTR